MTTIKRTINQILAPLTHTCNLLLANGLVPSKVKIVSVMPIYKANAPDEFSNYRPISLLLIGSKILEKAVFNRSTNFLGKNYILCEQQYVFRENFSTELALVDLTDRIAQAMDNKRVTVGVFIDLSKAFDILSHEILMGKLQHYGIRGLAMNWFRNYLKNGNNFLFSMMLNLMYD